MSRAKLDALARLLDDCDPKRTFREVYDGVPLSTVRRRLRARVNALLRERAFTASVLGANAASALDHRAVYDTVRAAVLRRPKRERGT